MRLRRDATCPCDAKQQLGLATGVTSLIQVSYTGCRLSQWCV